ncbi:TraB/GumN family protein [Salinarimonas soli]|nr:TraB/GumN family protein [Salinarimonas soli]
MPLVTGLLAGLLVFGSAARAACSLENITATAPPQDLEAAVDREIAARPERYSNGGSRFWAVSDPEGRPTGHLYGTLHIPHGIATWLPPRVYETFLASRRLAVEVDAGLPTPNRDALRFQHPIFMVGRGEPLSLAVERLAPGLLEPELRRYGITQEQADRAGPFALTRRLSGARCLGPHQAGASPFIADLLLQDWARALGKPIHALENQDAALRASGLDLPLPDQVQLLALALRRAQGDDAHVPALIRSYGAGRIDRAVAVGLSYLVDDTTRQAVDALDGRLYAGRNALFADRIDRLLRREAGLFAAFGAGHLIGEGGVVARLRERGWTVVPVPLQ